MAPQVYATAARHRPDISPTNTRTKSCRHLSFADLSRPLFFSPHSTFRPDRVKMDDSTGGQAQHEELKELKRRIREADVASHDDSHQFYGDSVLKHDTPTGDKLVIKFKRLHAYSDEDSIQTEADMMHYAATHGVLAPEVRAVYNIHTTSSTRPVASAMVSDRLPGDRLSEVWAGLSYEARSSIVAQLREQVSNMRSCTQSYIGRLNNRSTCNVYERMPGQVCGPFIDEENFDKWCLDRVPDGLFGLTRKKWARWLEKERQRPYRKFVLTHGNLSPHSIIVDDGVITGIVGWGRSGFWPEYAEYAFAMELFPVYQRRREEWWGPVLQQILPRCSGQRLKFTREVATKWCKHF